jgi:hypothetical protein
MPLASRTLPLVAIAMARMCVADRRAWESSNIIRRFMEAESLGQFGCGMLNTLGAYRGQSHIPIAVSGRRHEDEPLPVLHLANVVVVQDAVKPNQQQSE